MIQVGFKSNNPALLDGSILRQHVYDLLRLGKFDPAFQVGNLSKIPTEIISLDEPKAKVESGYVRYWLDGEAYAEISDYLATEGLKASVYIPKEEESAL